MIQINVCFGGVRFSISVLAKRLARKIISEVQNDLFFVEWDANAKLNRCVHASVS